MASLNPYRGCEHGCIYCYARPFHEYLGFSAGLDFESKIMVKEDAPELLRRELSSPKWSPQVVFMSGVTDCYQPVERKLKLTRRCLEVLAEFRNPVFIITKNQLVTRDIDVLSELARHNAVSVWLSITTLDPEIRRVMEPRTSPPLARLAALRELSKAGIPVGVNAAPMVPGLTDHEMPAILKAAAEAGATAAGYTVVRLPYAVAPMFEKWLETHFPARKEKVLNRLRAMHGGKLYDSTWGKRFSGEGIFADQIAQMFEVARRKAGIRNEGGELSTAAFRRAGGTQLSLFS
jgi:DNA repair photolyase